jgi:ATP-binding protein involved in chromosome partitioning
VLNSNHKREMLPDEKVKEAISKLIHPAINLSLTELGIVQDIEIIDDTVIVTFVFPFPDIPIADKLIGMLTTQVEKMGFKLEYIVRVMKKEEKEAFLRMEKKAWKGLHLK